jgi:hypothetical protein
MLILTNKKFFEKKEITGKGKLENIVNTHGGLTISGKKAYSFTQEAELPEIPTGEKIMVGFYCINYVNEGLAINNNSLLIYNELYNIASGSLFPELSKGYWYDEQLKKTDFDSIQKITFFIQWDNEALEKIVKLAELHNVKFCQKCTSVELAINGKAYLLII